MKSTKYTFNGMRVIVTGPDEIDQEVRVRGRVWRFDYCRRLGPTWLRKDGMPRKCQNPSKAVWREFERWLKGYNRVKKKIASATTRWKAEKESRKSGLNRRPELYKSPALPLSYSGEKVAGDGLEPSASTL